MLIQVKDIIQRMFKQTINHIIITKYDQPTDCIGWHNDKIKTIADNSIISLGAKRRFQLRSTPTTANPDPPVLKEIVTEKGSLINMSYNANLQYQHCVAPFNPSKGDEKDTRISIVFRNIKNKMKYDDIKAKVTAYHKRKESEKEIDEDSDEDD